MKTIKLRFAAVCRDCGAELPAGAEARWYGRGKVYGIGCHDAPARRDATAYERGDTSPGDIASHYDRIGVYAVDGTKLGSMCRCEDYPCCGH